ncbi:MAG TPA: exopolysaccharide Pel transporter PelG [Anaerolineales bacterium]|nr:exopolysaccharide Pel transporter PelG [Anaerolineales bacterium]
MAGIGFELKRLFNHSGIIMQMRAQLYAAAVITGPMILGATLLFIIKYTAQYYQMSGTDQDAVVVMTTWSILFPLLLTSLFTFVLARFIADMVYEEKLYTILPSMYFTISFSLLIGGLGWGVFLYFNDIKLIYKILTYILFMEATVAWIQISYTNATKDYRAVLMGFVYAITTVILVNIILFNITKTDPIANLLLSAVLGYFVMILSYTIVLHRYFPVGKGTAFLSWLWYIKYPSLIQVGFYSTIGLFAHIMMMWASPWGVNAIGHFYHAPQHDIPALFAFFTTLVATVNFVTSMEVKFYKHYKTFYSLLNDKGSLFDIQKAYKELVTVMKQELFYLAQIQIFVTMIAIVVLGELIGKLGLGFTSGMIGLFRVLTIGYGLYAVGNVFMLLQLYLVNFRGALITSLTLALVNVVGTYYILQLPEIYYGFGFVLAGFAMYIVGWIQLASYSRKLDYQVYSKQPIFVRENKGFFTKFIEYRDKIAHKR